MMLTIQIDNNDCRNKDNNDDGKRDADNDGDDVGDGYEDDKKIHLVLLCPEACRMGIRPTEMLFSQMNYYNISKIIIIIVIIVVSTILPGPSSNLGDAKKKILPNLLTLSLFPLGQYNCHCLYHHHHQPVIANVTLNMILINSSSSSSLNFLRMSMQKSWRRNSRS